MSWTVLHHLYGCWSGVQGPSLTANHMGCPNNTSWNNFFSLWHKTPILGGIGRGGSKTKTSPSRIPAALFHVGSHPPLWSPAAAPGRLQDACCSVSGKTGKAKQGVILFYFPSKIKINTFSGTSFQQPISVYKVWKPAAILLCSLLQCLLACLILAYLFESEEIKSWITACFSHTITRRNKMWHQAGLNIWFFYNIQTSIISINKY